MKFTKGYTPSPNVGRKPSRFKKLMASLDELGETISQEDFNKIVKTLLTTNAETLKKIANDKETPLVVAMIASAIAGDVESRQMGNLEKLLDRIFGRATQKTDITTDGQPVTSGLTVIRAIYGGEEINFGADDLEGKGDGLQTK